MNLNIGEPKALADVSIKYLNKLLSDEFVLLAKTWNFHWNVKGMNFYSDHKFLESIYTEIIDNIDDIAERIRSLGGRPNGSLQSYLADTRIKEYDQSVMLPAAPEMLKMILEDYETIIREIRSDLKELEKESPSDEGTLSYLQDFIYRAEKTCWMLRAHF
ncbi:MAG: DNA starvation/stationary phase protection protein [Bacteroidales bacterium]